MPDRGEESGGLRVAQAIGGQRKQRPQQAVCQEALRQLPGRQHREKLRQQRRREDTPRHRLRLQGQLWSDARVLGPAVEIQTKRLSILVVAAGPRQQPQEDSHFARYDILAPRCRT